MTLHALRLYPDGPTQVREPFHRDGWVYEEKVDGWRMLAYKDGGRVKLVSRNGRDHTRRFRDIAAAVAKLSGRTLVLDGEVAIFDQKFRSRFEWLREPDPDAIATPPMYIAFDVLYRNGRELTGRRLRERRARLEDVVAETESVVAEVLEQVLDETTILKVIERTIQKLNDGPKTVAEQRTALNAESKKLTKEIDRLYQHLVDGLDGVKEQIARRE